MSRTIVHVTHEAVYKVGGIGTVIHGLLTSHAYNQKTDRTILVCPLFYPDTPADDRLGPDGEVLYSSRDGRTDHPFADGFRDIESRFGTNIVYGTGRYHEPDTGITAQPEILLIDVANANLQLIDRFKAELWARFSVESAAHQDIWEFEQYVRLGPPAIAALHAMNACDEPHCIILAHEFMGMPTALAAKLDPWDGFRALFYAHETAPIRRIVEDHPGHDTMFYNALTRAEQSERFIEDVFGEQQDFFKFGLVKATGHCDRILAVGDFVVRELRFLTPELKGSRIDLTYNGIPAAKTTRDEKLDSKNRMRQYAENLFGWKPDDVFTHVGRMVTSKGFWRDLQVLEHLEKVYFENGRTAVYFLLSTEHPRSPEEVRHMETWWEWPLAHREGGSDLGGGEAIVNATVQAFNARSRNIKAVFVNQFGWTRELCGDRMPEDMSFLDIRCGSDAEFGLSIYEPFGIAQLEPLTYGAVCLVTNVCGCAGFATQAADGKNVPNVIVADYFGPIHAPNDPNQCVAQIDAEQRDALADRVARKLADQLWNNLPRDNATLDQRLADGYELAARMSWEVVAGQYVLPAIEKAVSPDAVPQPV